MKRLTVLALAVLALLGFVRPLAAQTKLFMFESKVTQFFGQHVAAGGDVNADGYPDLAVGGVAKVGSAFNVWLYSGRDGTLIRAFPALPDPLGLSKVSSLAFAGDVNKDGHADLIVGRTRDSKNGHSSGAFTVYSGKDGRQLYIFHGSKAHIQLGWSVNGAGDVNADGFDDFIASALG